jgi:hypothetical protein
MIEEIKARQTNQEQSKKVGSSQDGAGVTMLDAVSELLGSQVDARQCPIPSEKISSPTVSCLLT